jgi:hypothetical protein
MPCRICGESAREKHSGSCFDLSYDEDGNASYLCLDCGIDVMKEVIDSKDKK